MLASEAFTVIEKRLTALDLFDQWGDPIVGLEAIPMIAEFHGEVLAAVESAFEAGIVPPEVYADAMLTLINEFAAYRTAKRVDRTFTELFGAKGEDQCAG